MKRALLLTAFLLFAACAWAQVGYDLVITNGRIVDGSGNPWYVADVGIRDGRIVAIGRLCGTGIPACEAKRVIDAKNLIVAPGFIDVHTHVEGGILRVPTADNYLFDGVTSIITGNCGGSLGANARNSDLWFVAATGEGAPRRLTEHPRSDSRPRWSPDGKRLAFVSAREQGSQVWVMDMAGGEPRRVTSLATGAGGVLWVDAGTLLVTSDVFPQCNAPRSGGLALHDEACNKRRLEAAGKPDSGRLYESLLFRSWDSWEDHRRTHLLVVPLAEGEIRDLTPGHRDVPPFSLGGAEDYAVSPDGREVAFARNDDPVPATSTNAELWVVPTAWGAPRKVSFSPGYDGAPVYSPDGRLIAFRAQERAGYEADRWRLKASSARNLGWAMSMSSRARSRSDLPNRCATPYSVTT